MNIAKLSAVLVTGALFVTAASVPVRAASPATEAFLANVTPNVDFLDRSSRMALDNTKTARLRDFAHAEAAEQTLAANSIWETTQASKATYVASAEDTGALQTGRSVAVDSQATAVADSRLPLGQEDLDFLGGLQGSEFDAPYKEKQRDALSQLVTDYKDYIAKGDDPLLLAIANRELPKVEHRLVLLGKI